MVTSNYTLISAALHSFTISLRHQLKDTSVQVIEVLPGPVATEITDTSEMENVMDLDVFGDDVLRQLVEGVKEIAHPDFQGILRGDRDLWDLTFDQWNGVVKA